MPVSISKHHFEGIYIKAARSKFNLEVLWWGERVRICGIPLINNLKCLWNAKLRNSRGIIEWIPLESSYLHARDCTANHNPRAVSALIAASASLSQKELEKWCSLDVWSFCSHSKCREKCEGKQHVLPLCFNSTSMRRVYKKLWLPPPKTQINPENHNENIYFNKASSSHSEGIKRHLRVCLRNLHFHLFFRPGFC